MASPPTARPAEAAQLDVSGGVALAPLALATVPAVVPA